MCELGLFRYFIGNRKSAISAPKRKIGHDRYRLKFGTDADIVADNNVVNIIHSNDEKYALETLHQTVFITLPTKITQ